MSTFIAIFNNSTYKNIFGLLITGYVKRAGIASPLFCIMKTQPRFGEEETKAGLYSMKEK